MTSFFDLPFEEPPSPEPADSAQSGVVREPTRRRILSVSELTAGIRTLLEERFVELWVEGELSNCRVWNTGHMYFTLKDGARRSKA